ncbi:MAG: GNAT family N-acetyltransferase [Planctomycetota bacterium]|jgi:hypothetical protein
MDPIIPRIIVYEAEWSDRGPLHDIDIKCFDDVWDESRWVHWVGQGDRVVFVAETKGREIGMAACMILTDGLYIEKIGVKPNYRGMGASREIMTMVKGRAFMQQWPHIVSITIPEPALLDPGPSNIAGWVRKIGFKAKPPLEPNCFTINGESVNGVPFLLEDE